MYLLDGFAQRVEVEWLVEHHAGTQLMRTRMGRFVAEGRDQDDPTHPADLAQALQRVQSTQPRHPDVRHDDTVRPVVPRVDHPGDTVEQIDTVARLDDVPSGTAER